MAGQPANGPSGGARIVANTLRIDAATADVLGGFSAGGVQSLLLKGISIARWLYEPGERPYGDFDLLIRPYDRAAAEGVLSELGFERTVDERDMPEWWGDHAATWLRHTDAVALDLHRTVPGVGVGEEALWTTLSEHTQAILVGNREAAALQPHGLAFHVALHAAQHGELWDDMLAELERALERADHATWTQAAELAAELDATPAFATGLRLVPAGRALAAELNLPATTATAITLRATTPPAIALGFDQLARTRGLRGRLGLLRHKLFPPPTFIRHQFPQTGPGRLELVRAYVKRWRWLAEHAPEGFRAWRKARKSA